MMNEYIFRGTESETASVSEKKKMSRGTRCLCKAVIAIVMAAVLCSGGYGISLLVQAAPNAEREAQQRNTAELLAKLQQAEELMKSGQSITTAQGTVFTTEAAITDETQELSTAETLKSMTISEAKPVSIAENLEQEVTVGYELAEENLSGLSWNEDLIADIAARIEEAGSIEDNEEFDEDDYKELLVTLGMDEDYVSDESKAPDYLTMEYNPKMVMELTDTELSALLTLVEAEAPSEDIYGKILVANVVLNRVFSESFKDDVRGVIFEKVGGSAQFSPTAIKWYWNSIKVTDSTREAVARCLSGEDYSDGALYFYAWAKHPNKQKTSSWLKKCECLFTHGGHIFFR